MYGKVLLLIATASLMHGPVLFSQICCYGLPNDKYQLTYFLLLVFGSILLKSGLKR